MELKVTLPVLVFVDDYHDLDGMEADYQLLNRSIKVMEVGYSAPWYVGVVFAGKQPTKAEIDALLQAAAVELAE